MKHITKEIKNCTVKYYLVCWTQSHINIFRKVKNFFFVFSACSIGQFTRLYEVCLDRNGTVTH